MAQPTDAHAGHAGEPHVLPLSIYWGVFLALVVGTIVTVWTATIDLGALNLVVALAIATVKASLVILFFMHVKYSSRLTQVFVVAAFLWLGIMFVFTFADYATRAWTPNSRGWNDDVLRRTRESSGMPVRHATE